jgi:hypothetical protein
MKRSAWRYLWKSEDITKKTVNNPDAVDHLPPGSQHSVPGSIAKYSHSLGRQAARLGTLFNLLDLLSGGTVSNFSILAMGFIPTLPPRSFCNCWCRLSRPCSGEWKRIHVKAASGWKNGLTC